MRSIKNIAPVLLALLSIAMAAYQLLQNIDARKWTDPSNEMVMQWEDHVQPLRQALPPGINIVGYLDKSMILERPEDFDGEEFFLMQYSLAPIALEAGVGRPWIIGNFGSNADFRPWLDKKLGRYEVQDFGFGFYLIHDLDG